MFYFHGFPGSRIEASLLDSSAQRQGARLIGIDRPGYGCSDRLHPRRFADWARDVASLADALGIGEFAVIGVSGGAPYALASAALLDGRITNVTTVCGLGPLCAGGGSVGMTPQRRFACRLLRMAPWMIPFLSSTMAQRLARQPESVFTYLLAQVPAPDLETLTKPENRALLQASFTEAVRHGASGMATDALLYLSSWEFDPGTIHTPVVLWHGEVDGTVPARMSCELAKQLPQARLVLLPEEGHYSLPFRHHHEILESALAT